MDLRWQKRLKVRRVSTIAIIASLLILSLFAGFTIYGNKVGNFVINVNNDGVKLSLSIHDDLSEPTDRLTFSGMAQISDITYSELPEDIAIKETSKGIQGEKSVDHEYLAFSFYLINYSSRAVDYDMDLNLIDTAGDPLPIMRVMLIEGDRNVSDLSNRIYAKAENDDAARQYLKDGLERCGGVYESEDFDIENKRLFSVQGKDLGVSAAQKYTVILWIEGCDKDCTNERLGSRVKMQLDIFGY